MQARAQARSTNHEGAAMALEFMARDRTNRRSIVRSGWIAVTLTLLWCGTARADAVTDWNKFAISLIAPSRPGTEIPVGGAYMHIAMFDAINAIEGGYIPFAVELSDVPPGASPIAAAAAAAHVILSRL